MPWKCPACLTQIAHTGDAPEPRRVYRCHVCHLELMLDETTHKLTLAPLVTGDIRRVTDAEPELGQPRLGARSLSAERSHAKTRDSQ